MSIPASKTFLITGVSSGFGRAFAEGALERRPSWSSARCAARPTTPRPSKRWRPAARTRCVLDVTDFGGYRRRLSRDAERQIGPDRRAGQQCRLRPRRRARGVAAGRPAAAVRRQRVRRRRDDQGRAARHARAPSGHIINITSMGGFITMPGIAYYCGSKFALEGISEALGKEVAGFGIQVTAVAPGPFRTDWAGRSMVRTPRSIADYDAVFDPIRAARQAKSGKQPGDPAKAAQALLELVAAENPPVAAVPRRRRAGAGRTEARGDEDRARRLGCALALDQLRG